MINVRGRCKFCADRVGELLCSKQPTSESTVPCGYPTSVTRAYQGEENRHIVTVLSHEHTHTTYIYPIGVKNEEADPYCTEAYSIHSLRAVTGQQGQWAAKEAYNTQRNWACTSSQWAVLRRRRGCAYCLGLSIPSSTPPAEVLRITTYGAQDFTVFAACIKTKQYGSAIFVALRRDGYPRWYLGQSDWSSFGHCRNHPKTES